MARAKRTDRNEARRRYRAELAARRNEIESEELTSDQPLPANTPARDVTRPRATTNGGAARTVTPASAVRPGIMTAFRAAFRPLDLRGDLAAAGPVLTHWSVLLTVGLTLATTAILIASANELGASFDATPGVSGSTSGTALSPLTYAALIMFQFFLSPPPAAGAFLVGFLAKRASWLGGALVGLVAAGCYTAIILSPIGPKATDHTALITQAFVMSPLGAAFFASAAAWYRRFLNLANPNRDARRPNRPSAKQRSKPAAARSGGRR